jgi:hypothetical protein
MDERSGIPPLKQKAGVVKFLLELVEAYRT